MPTARDIKIFATQKLKNPNTTKEKRAMMFEYPLTKSKLAERKVAKNYYDSLMKGDMWNRPFANILRRERTPSWLEGLAKKLYLPSPIPLQYVLKKSCYYPGSGFDISPIAAINGFVHSYVYSDYGVREIDLLERINENEFMHGYTCLLSRKLEREEVMPGNWIPSKPKGRYNTAWLEDARKKSLPFGNWSIWQRAERYDDKIGPPLFSLLFLGGEGVTCHNGLYKRNGITPKALALIQQGQNWTNFYSEKGELWRAIVESGEAPDIVISGFYRVRSDLRDEECYFSGYSYAGNSFVYDTGFITTSERSTAILDNQISRFLGEERFRDGWHTINLFVRSGA